MIGRVRRGLRIIRRERVHWMTRRGRALIAESVRRHQDQLARCARCPHLDCCRKHGGLY